MKIKLTAEVEYATNAIHAVEESGDIGEYSFDIGEGHLTGESWYRLETAEGEHIERINRNEFDYATVADYIKHLETLDNISDLDIDKWTEGAVK